MARSGKQAEEKAAEEERGSLTIYDREGTEYHAGTAAEVTRLIHAHGYSFAPPTGEPDPATVAGGGLEVHDVPVETADEQKE